MKTVNVPKDFPDSKIAKGFTFGRTKAVYALNSVFFLPFYLTEKHQICILYRKTSMEKNCMKNMCKNYLKIFLIKVCGIPRIRRKALSLLL